MKNADLHKAILNKTTTTQEQCVKCFNWEFQHSLIFLYFNRFKIDIFNFHLLTANISTKCNISTKWNAPPLPPSPPTIFFITKLQTFQVSYFSRNLRSLLWIGLNQFWSSLFFLFSTSKLLVYSLPRSARSL